MQNSSESPEQFLHNVAEDTWLTEIRDYFPSAWIGHAPFLKFLIREESPNTVVELGTHFGFSYFVACQTIQELQLPTQAFAVDHWLGDAHASLYDDSVYKSVVSFNKKYENFSKLLKMNFIEARAEVLSEVDLLHIDGFHTYEAVKEDFETWLPKMSPNGIILLHDIHVRRSDFGVYKFWSEIKELHSTIEFTGAHGLGVVFLGNQSSEKMIRLIQIYNSGLKLQIQGVFGSHADIAIQKYREREVNELNLLIRDLKLNLGLLGTEFDKTFGAKKLLSSKIIDYLKFRLRFRKEPNA